jgi:type VI secretion system secreted protein Hcp
MSTNTYLKFEQPEIAGAATDPRHSREIEVLAWSHGFVQPGSATREGSVEQAQHQNLTFTKSIDSSTNELLRHCWSGKPIGKATLRCYRAAATPGAEPVQYLSVEMEQVILSSYALSGGPGDVPVENISMDYGTVRYVYHDHAIAGSGRTVSVKHDLRKRTVE